MREENNKTLNPEVVKIKHLLIKKITRYISSGNYNPAKLSKS